MSAEKELFAACRAAFDNRMNAEGIKKFSKKWEKELETFMQGVLATATYAGIMSIDRANQICFYRMCSRLSEIVGYERERR